MFSYTERHIASITHGQKAMAKVSDSMRDKRYTFFEAVLARGSESAQVGSDNPQLAQLAVGTSRVRDLTV